MCRYDALITITSFCVFLSIIHILFAVTSSHMRINPQVGAATIRSPWPYFSSKLESFGLTIPQEQYALYGTTLFAIGASRKPFMQAYWMNKYLRETDESVKMIYAFRGKFSHVELNGGEAYLKELRRVPHRWALLPLSFIIVEGTRIAYKRLFSSKFNDH